MAAAAAASTVPRASAVAAAPDRPRVARRSDAPSADPHEASSSRARVRVACRRTRRRCRSPPSRATSCCPASRRVSIRLRRARAANWPRRLPAWLLPRSAARCAVARCSAMARSSAARCSAARCSCRGPAAIRLPALLCRRLLGGTLLGCPALLCRALQGRSLFGRTLLCCPALFGCGAAPLPVVRPHAALLRGAARPAAALFGGSLFGCGTLFRGGTFLGGAVFCRSQLGRPREPFLSGRLGLRLSAMGTAEQRRRRPFMFWRMRFGRHVDDRAFLGAGRSSRSSVPLRRRCRACCWRSRPGRAGRVGLDRGAVLQVGVEEVSPGWRAARRVRPATRPPRRRPGPAARRTARGAAGLRPSARTRGARRSRDRAAGRRRSLRSRTLA